MKKIIIGAIAFVLLYEIGFILLAGSLLSEVDKYKVEVGHKCVLEKDTLTVVDYSTIMETFTLSNGKTVSSSFIFNNKTIR